MQDEEYGLTANRENQNTMAVECASGCVTLADP